VVSRRHVSLAVAGILRQSSPTEGGKKKRKPGGKKKARSVGCELASTEYELEKKKGRGKFVGVRKPTRKLKHPEKWFREKA